MNSLPSVELDSPVGRQGCLPRIHRALEILREKVCSIFERSSYRASQLSLRQLSRDITIIMRQTQRQMPRKNSKVFTTFYSRNELSVTQKLQKQLRYARVNNSHYTAWLNYDFSFKDLNAKGPPGSYLPLSSAVTILKGQRPRQEDGFLENSEVKFLWKGKEIRARLFGVFDGHSDLGQVSEHLNQYLIPSLIDLFTKAQEEYEELGDEVITNAFTQVFDDLTQSYCKAKRSRRLPFNDLNDPSQESFGGAEVTCAFAIKNKIYIPNVGDSRTILIKQNRTVIPLTEDGTLDNFRFAHWYTKKERPGYKLEKDEHQTYRVWGNGIHGLMCGRDVGNPAICSRPKITRIFIGKGTDQLEEGLVYCDQGDFILMASDGLWDVANVDQVADAVWEMVSWGYPLNEISDLIAAKAAASPRSDNVTVKIIAI